MIIYKKFKSIFYFLIFFVFVELSFCQVKVGDWNSLTSSLQIRDVQFIENTLFMPLQKEGFYLSKKMIIL